MIERLTTKEYNNLIECTFCSEQSICYDSILCDEIEKAIERLKEYENTGFTPEQVVEMAKELAEYKKLDEQGLLLKLPCKVGDTVYTLNTLKNKKIVLGQIEEIDAFFIALCMMENRFGKTVFLTKEEAEAKLKEMEGK